MIVASDKSKALNQFHTPNQEAISFALEFKWCTGSRFALNTEGIDKENSTFLSRL